MKNFLKSLLLIAVCLQAASASNGSAYSRYGVGEPSVFSTSRAAALGATGLALAAEGYINQDNPATLGTVTRTLFNGGYQYRGYGATDGTTSSYLNSGGFLNASFAFPVYKPYGIVFALGFSPVTNVGYYFNLKETHPRAGTIEQSFDGRGGLSALRMSLSYAPAADLYFGMTADYAFGTIRAEQALNYPNSTFFASQVTRTSSIHGFTFRGGALYTGIDRALGLSTTKHLSLGLTVLAGGSLSTNEEDLIHLSTVDTTVLRPDGTVKIPVGAGFGLAYQNAGKVYTADVQMQQWGDFTRSGVHPSELQNSLRAGAGIEWMPSRDFTASYWQQTAYRLGAYAQKTNVYLNGASINEYFATAGIGLPLGNDARVNLGLEYGIRGTTSSSLIKNNIIRFTLSISAGDVWFIQSEVE
ncbi:MAG: hypothetical protein ACM3Q4_05445 [Acidobacteriota bacterium]